MTRSIRPRWRLGTGLVAGALLAAFGGSPAAAAGGLPFPLPSGSHYVFGTPNPPQTNTFVVTGGFWSVVGILAPSRADYRLAVSDPGGSPLASVDSPRNFNAGFVAVNSNFGHAPTGTYQARMSVVRGRGKYGMEYSNPNRLLRSDPGAASVYQSIPMGSGEFITISDVWLNAGQTYTFANDFCGGLPNCAAVHPGLYGVSAIMPSTSNVVAGLDQALIWCGGGPGPLTGCFIGNTVPSQSGYYAVVTIVVNRPSSVTPSIKIGGSFP